MVIYFLWSSLISQMISYILVVELSLSWSLCFLCSLQFQIYVQHFPSFQLSQLKFFRSSLRLVRQILDRDLLGIWILCSSRCLLGLSTCESVLPWQIDRLRQLRCQWSITALAHRCLCWISLKGLRQSLHKKSFFIVLFYCKKEIIKSLEKQ